MDFLADIKENATGPAKAPAFPQLKPFGFPPHKKRTRPSASKQQRHDGAHSPASPPQPAQSGPSRASQEKRAVEQEVESLLASMSPEQIEEQRRDLLENMDPALLQMLLRRANIDDHPSTSVFDDAPSADAPASLGNGTATAPPPPPPPPAKADKPRKTVRFDADDATPPPLPAPADLFEAGAPPPRPSSSNPDAAFAANTTHFPQPKALPDLDPADPDFLETLHAKYFPSLPADPAKLAWMAPLPTPHSTADRESPYYPGQSSLSLAALRFDFNGRLLSPAKSRAIPVFKGLHHHGEAPEAAGYTVAELGRLARSAVPAQRCVAFQTLGRLLFRLGNGEWGDGGAEVARGIWRCCQENRVVDSLLEAAAVPEGSGHRGSRVYAMEAVWLFEKGGWREKFQGR